MYASWQAVAHVVSHDVAGDIVECGVWRGGSAMLMGLALRDMGATRQMYLYDTFEGMSDPSDRDIGPGGRRVADAWAATKENIDDPLLCYASLAEVQANLRSVGLEGAVTYVQGKVEDTLPARAPSSISVLRLDTDWYESTLHELRTLWPLLSHGGVLLIDDYGYWKGAREAVDEFFSTRDDAPLLARTDGTGRLGIKR
jgi:predicted O-methyltransferase YrrM